MEALEFDQIVPLGILALLGGVLLWLPIGFLVGRRYGGTAGIGTGMVLFGLTGLAFAGWLAWHVFVQTRVVVLERTACEALPSPPGLKRPRERSRDVHQLVMAGSTWRLVTPPQWEGCRDEPRSTRLRFRIAALVPGVPEVPARAENDVRQAPMLVGVFGAFGGFGLLGGLIMALSAARERGAFAPPPDQPPLPPWRAHTATAFTMAGNLGLLAAVLMTLFFEDEGGVVWGTHQLFRAVGIACACWIGAALLRRRLTIEMLLIFVLVGGAFWLAAASLKFMTGG